jgi:hypothetical protein
MAWAYCRSCEGALDAPGIRDALIGYIKCTHCDSIDYHVDEDTRISVIDEFVEQHDKLVEAHPRTFNAQKEAPPPDWKF